MAALSIEQVLTEEADALHGTNWRAGLAEPKGQEAHSRRTHLSADDRSRAEPDTAEAERLRKFYRALNSLDRAALCCSGGGIRSATFCLGVIEALAAYDVRKAARAQHGKSSDHAAQSNSAAHVASRTGAEPQAKTKNGQTISPENSLLGRFHYLSTVSGGGYVGSWLSSWRARDDFAEILRNLTGRPDGADTQPPEISWLRAYSNYLTPRIGLGSADTWAAVAICVRNVILNWLIIVPVVGVVLLLLKLIATVSVWIAHSQNDDWIVIAVLLVGIACLMVAQAFTTRHRPTRRPPAAGTASQPANVNDNSFVRCDLIWAVLSAIAVTIFFSSRYFSQQALSCANPGTVQWLGVSTKFALPGLTAVIAVPIYWLGWRLGFPANATRKASDQLSWTASGLIYGGLIGVGAYLYAMLGVYSRGDCIALPDHRWHFLTPAIFGVPWVLVSQLAADSIFIGLVSYEPNSDADREWLGRAAGWLAAIAIAWAVVAFLVFAASFYVEMLFSAVWKILIASTGGAAGIVAALLGSSAKTPAKSNGKGSGSRTAIAYNIALAVAGPAFAALLIVGLSIALDKLLLGTSLVSTLLSPAPDIGLTMVKLVVSALVAAAIGAAASYVVNINRFSLHALYRNRLIRAYLGASRQKRHPDHFTGFDPEDNIRVHELWPPMAVTAADAHNLFHVINITLNLVSGERLAWQERKAESFTVSPLHSGSAYLGFRPSAEYGDGENMPQETVKNTEDQPAAENSIKGQLPAKDSTENHHGIALGTAMAISGAAVSPNMGYHSSPSITLLLALFNVRLGWWLGNPGKPGDETYRSEGPRWAAKPLFYEAFGRTTDQSRYVYLSDGGHFENLGLYEMVRRRCRLIVVIDAGCDPNFAFEDLGNAVRKIYIDLGVAIRFNNLDKLQNRPSRKVIQRDPDHTVENIPYCAIAKIDYASADGSPPEDNGTILYIKPAYHDTEGAGIRSYANAHPKFPHESTTDQWFTESQFESYRSLGYEIAEHVFQQQGVGKILTDYLRPTT